MAVGLTSVAGNFFNRLAAWIINIGSDPADSVAVALQKRLTVGLSLGPVPATALWSATYVAAGAGLSGLIPGGYTLAAIANTALFARTRSLELYRFSQLLLILLLPWMLMMSLGGFADSSAVIVWSALAPLGALVLDNLRRGVLWLFGFIALLCISALAQPYLVSHPLPELLTRWLFVLNLGTVISIALVMLYYFVGQRDYFQARAETLLLNILPEEIAEILKSEQRTIANQHDAASILFADVVEFTPMAAAMTARELVELLNEVFECFDDLVDKYALEKIKTIGDCYMVAAGVPHSRPDHALALVSLAIDMRTLVAGRTFAGHQLVFRIGINSGPVVAGVIGHKKFIYDLWGDAVNLASRMESHGTAGAIQITRPTYELVRHEFHCEPRGMVRVKGAGEVEAWHVLGRIDE